MIIGFDGVTRRSISAQEEDQVLGDAPRSTPAGTPDNGSAHTDDAAETSSNLSFNLEAEVQRMVYFFDSLDDSLFSYVEKEDHSIIVDRLNNQVSNQSTPIPHGLLETNSSKAAI